MSGRTWLFTHDGSEKKIYINGLLSGSGIQDGLYTGDTGRGIIGRHSMQLSSEYQFLGNIDEVRVWSRAKTQEEVAATMNKEVTPNAQNLVAYFKLNESSGTTTLNSAYPANSGTLINGPVWVIPSTVPLNYSYLWSTGATTPDVSVTDAGT